MKSIIQSTLLTILLLSPAVCFSQAPSKEKKILGVFVGRTPCQELAQQLNETVSHECIKIKWQVTLYQDPSTGKPDGYEMVGFAYQRGNPRKGSWTITKGTQADPDAVVYSLEEAGKETLFFQKADDNILLFLDPSKKLMVGNRDFSYALNRMEKAKQ